MRKTKVNAFILKKKNHKLELLKELILPSLQSGQVLVKIIFTSICGSQIMEIKGKRGKDKYLPHGLGHEGLAEVVATGPSVKKVKSGDKIILTWIKSKGANCKGIKINLKNDKTYNFGPITTLSNYSIVSENRCVKKPLGLKDELAAFFGCSISTGFGVVFNTIKRNNINCSIGIYGLGSVGIFSLIAAKCLGIKRIFVIEKNKYRCMLAKKFGAKIVNIKNPKIDILRLNNNKLLDYCYESVGYAKTIEKAFDIITNQGYCYTSSHPSKKEVLRIDPHELIKGKKIFGSWGGYTNPDKDYKKYSKILTKNYKILSKVKIKKYKFSQMNKAIIDFSTNKIIKPLIKC